MDKYTQALILINSNELTIDQQVQLFEVIVSKIDINTIQGMADSKGISYNGVKKSGRFKKLMVGCQKMAVNGVVDDKLPC